MLTHHEIYMKFKWNEFSPSAQEAIRYFNLILEADHWEDEANTEKRLDQGMAVYPHATRSISNRHCRLEASLRIQVDMISLDLIPHDDDAPGVSLHFLYQEDPIQVLEAIVQAREWLQPGLYFSFTLQLTSVCHEVLVEAPNREICTFSSQDT